MQLSESPGDMLARLAKDFFVSTYKLCILLATGLIILGKFVFDNLYKLVDTNKKGQTEVRRVVYETEEESNNNK